MNWPSPYLPPINLWSAPRMHSTTKYWRSTGHTIVLTRGMVTVSIEVPIRGMYTDARLWNGLFRDCLRLLENRLELAEWKHRI